MAQASLAVDGISKAFGETRAVRGLSLDAAPGEVIGLLGPNGAGKTTAIRILTTIYAPDSGSFAVDGIPYTKPSAIRKRIGVLPESAGYPLHQSGEEFVQYFARLFGQSRKSARETAKTLLAEVGLAGRAAPRTARVRVPEENHESALSALKRVPGVGDAQAVNGGRGLISATLDGPDTNAPIRALLGAGIPILSFEVEGGKLSDAFLALTGEAGE